MERIDEIQAAIMAGASEKGEPRCYGIYAQQARLAAMSIFIAETLCSSLSGNNPEEWVMEQTSREGNARSKADPKLKELATYLQLSGQLLEKCKGMAFMF